MWFMVSTCELHLHSIACVIAQILCGKCRSSVAGQCVAGLRLAQDLFQLFAAVQKRVWSTSQQGRSVAQSRGSLLSSTIK